MAKTDAAGKKTLGPVFSNELKYMEFVYDAALDSKVFNDQIVLGVTSDAIVIHESLVIVNTAVTSGGSATVKIGDTDNDDSFLTATAVASLTINATFDETTGQALYLASGKEIILVPLVADLLTGKMTLKLTYSLA